MAVQLIVDRAGNISYQARFGTGGAGQTRFFAVGKHGGHRQAMLKARQAERELMERCTSPRDPARLFGNNTSGIKGLALRHGSAHSWYIQVTWSKDRRQQCTRFWLNKHGVIEGTRLALALREKMAGYSTGLSARQAWNILRRTSGCTLKG